MSKEQISFKEFKKLEIKIGTIVEVERISGSDKLYLMKVDMGDEKRQIVAGLVEYYKKEELLGKKIAVVVNLKPAKIYGKMSYGMLLAAEKGPGLALLTVDRDIDNGAVIT